MVIYVSVTLVIIVTSLLNFVYHRFCVRYGSSPCNASVHYACVFDDVILSSFSTTLWRIQIIGLIRLTLTFG